MPPLILGLNGNPRVGKDTFAKILVDQHGFERRAFADLLYESLRRLNPHVEYFHSRHRTPAPGEFHRLADLVAWHGWDVLKERVPDLRPLLQRMGTEVGRELYGQSFWVDAVFRDMREDGRYVITDMRFPNELDAVELHSGWTIHIDRPGFGTVNNHASETALALAEFDFYFTNDGDLEQLADYASHILGVLDVPNIPGVSLSVDSALTG